MDARHPQPCSGVPSPGVAGLDPHDLAFLLHWLNRAGGRVVIELGAHDGQRAIEVRRTGGRAGPGFLVEVQRGGVTATRDVANASPERLATDLIALAETHRLPDARPRPRLVPDVTSDDVLEETDSSPGRPLTVTTSHVDPSRSRGPLAMTVLVVAALALIVALALPSDQEAPRPATIAGAASTGPIHATPPPTAPPAARRPLRTPDTREFVSIRPVPGLPVRASGSSAGHLPHLARDGDPATAWLASGEDETWLEVDLGAAQTVSGIGLVVGQARAAPTLHRMLVAADGERYRIVHYFGQTTADGDALVYRPMRPIRGVRYIRIETMSGPVGSGWREVAILTP